MNRTLCLDILAAWLVALLTVAGCGPPQQGDPLAQKPSNENDSISNKSLDKYILNAVSVAGGNEAWADATKIEFECVVTFYKNDNSLYLTEHFYEIYPWSDAIRLSVVEPSGKFVWLLSGDNFKIEMTETMRKIPGQMESITLVKELMYAVRDLTIAPVKLYRYSSEFVREDTALKIKGAWYYPVEYLYPAESEMEPVKPHWFKAVFFGAKPKNPPKPYWSKAVLYQNRQTSLVEMLRFVPPFEKSMELDEQESRRAIAVRGYDYRETEGPKEPGIVKDAVLIPTKIEMFESKSQDIIAQRIVKLDLKY